MTTSVAPPAVTFPREEVIALLEQLGALAGQDLLTLALQLQPKLRPDALPATDLEMLAVREEAQQRVSGHGYPEDAASAQAPDTIPAAAPIPIPEPPPTPKM